MEEYGILHNIFAVQGDLQEIIRLLLKSLVLEHNDAGNDKSDPNVALSNIFAKCFAAKTPGDVLRTLKANYDSIYDKSTSSPRKVKLKSSIDINSLDSSFMFDILESIEGFPTYNVTPKHKRSVKNHCKNGNKSTHIVCCCSGCKHLCPSCCQVNCSKSCPAFGQDLPCEICQKTKPICKRDQLICCPICQLCRRCGKLVSESNQCNVLKLCLGIEIAHLLRNLFGHLTKQVCEDFISGKIKLKGFQSNTWNDFTKVIVDATKKILHYMTNQINFSKQQPLLLTKAERLIRRVETILENDSAYVKEYFLDSMLKGVKDVEKEDSKQLREITKKFYSDLQEIKQSQYVIQEGQQKLENGQQLLQKGHQLVLEKFNETNEKLDMKLQYVQQTSSEAINAASNALKELYLKKYFNENCDTSCMSRDEMIVDVTLVDYDKKVKGKGYGLEKLITESNEYTVLNGEPGAGKTTLMRTLVCKWASGELLNGKDGSHNFDFVFLLFCRNFNKYEGKSCGIEDYIANEYSRVFDTLTIQDLRRNKQNILLIIEGFDECTCYEEFQRMTDDLKDASPYCRAMYDLLNPENEVLPFHRLVTTRPSSETLMKRFNNANCQLKSVEIFGFSPTQIYEYIDKQFRNDQRRAEMVKNKLHENPQISQLASRPAFCWIFCSLFKEDSSYDIPKSITSIYGSIILIFLQHHGAKRKSVPLEKLFSISEVQTTLFNLAEIAYMSLLNGNIAFTAEDVKMNGDVLNEVKKESGLIESTDNNHFQFTHLSFHEFLAAFHIYLNNLYVTKSRTKANERIFSSQSVSLFLAGFMGGNLENSKSHTFTKMFSKIKEQKETSFKSCIDLLKSIEPGKGTSLHYELLFEFQNPIGLLPDSKCLFLPPTLNILSSYHEMCIYYLFDYIKKHNNNKLPFDTIILDQVNVDQQIVSLVVPYLKNLKKFIVLQCSSGFIKSISSQLPFIQSITLPHCNVTLNDWTCFVKEFEEASKETIRLEEFSVEDFLPVLTQDYGFYYNHEAILPKPVYKMLRSLRVAELQFNLNRLNLLTNDNPQQQQQSKLKYLILTFNKIEQFCNFLEKHIGKLPNLQVAKVNFLSKCRHTTTEKRRFLRQRRERLIEYPVEQQYSISNNFSVQRHSLIHRSKPMQQTSMPTKLIQKNRKSMQSIDTKEREPMQPHHSTQRLELRKVKTWCDLCELELEDMLNNVFEEAEFEIRRDRKAVLHNSIHYWNFEFRKYSKLTIHFCVKYILCYLILIICFSLLYIFV